jgi:hypothetical protein
MTGERMRQPGVCTAWLFFSCAANVSLLWQQTERLETSTRGQKLRSRPASPCQFYSATAAAAVTPFPSFPLQVLHKRVCEYLELDTRVEVLNTR